MTKQAGRPKVVIWRERLAASGEDSNTKLTGMMLSLHMNAAGANGGPGTDRLVEECSSSVASVKRGLARLKAGGWVTPTANRGGGRGLTVVYEVALPDTKGVHTEPVSPSKEDHTEPVPEPLSDTKGAHRRPERGSQNGRKGLTVSPPLVGIELLEEQPIAPPAAKPRKADPIWDTLIEVCGINPTEIPKSSRGAINKAVAELRGVRATPTMIRERAVEYQRRFDHAALTPNALVKHWASLGTPTPRSTQPAVVKTVDAAAEWLALRGHRQ